MLTTYDCIVLGLGGVGSAAAWELARRGLRVLGLEQFGPAHDRGSSHGESRIIRKAYFEHPDYVPLLHAAYVAWEQLEAASGRRLFDRTGLFLCGPADGEAIPGTLRAARQHALPLETLAPHTAARQFRQCRFTDRDVVLFERDAGRLHVETCVQAQLQLARHAGADLRFHEQVTDWTTHSRGVRVSTDRGSYAAGRLVITAGAWAGRLLVQLDVPLRVLRKVQAWFPSPGIAANAPAFYFEEPEGSFYGLPSPAAGLVKVAEHSGGDTVDDSRLVDRHLHAADVERLADFLARRLPACGREPLRHSVCLYTMSPDGHFLLDHLPEAEQVWFAAGLSGHGFKFAPILGRALAGLATEGHTDLPVAFLRMSRLNTGPPVPCRRA